MDVVVKHAPRFTREDALRLASRLFGVGRVARPLASERDQNFHIADDAGAGYVLKIANATERREFLDFQNQALEHLAAHGLPHVPRVARTRERDTISSVSGRDGETHFVRLLTFVPGEPIALVKPHGEALLESLGRRLGEMDRALVSFAHPAMRRSIQWDLRQAGWAAAQASRIGDARTRALAERALARFEAAVAPVLPSLRTSVIHNDWNEHNVLVSVPPAPEREVVTAVDFGDIVHSCTVCDPAIAVAYAMLGKPDPIAAAAAVVRGYHGAFPLEEPEIAVLYDLARTRLAISAVMAACQQEQAPENDYLRISQRQVRELLERLADVSPDWAHYVFRHACGLAPCPRTAAVVEWLARNGDRIGRLTDYDLADAPAVVFDLSAGSPEIASPAEAADTPASTARLFDRIAAAGAVVGIGRYDEARMLYTSELFAKPGNDGPQARTIHLGVDLFLAPGSPVYAPLDGRVHSFRHNAASLDYGPTIILEHVIEPGALSPQSSVLASDQPLAPSAQRLSPDAQSLLAPSAFSQGSWGPTPTRPHLAPSRSARAAGAPLVPARFYTLYGHLSADSIEGLREGQPVRRGERIGRIGDPSVNGGWPPHLHVQIVTDLLGKEGDFPGVAAPREREVWLSLSPDPNLVLRRPGGCAAPRSLPQQDLLARRRQSLGYNLSVSYRRPLTIVRGFMQHLYDDDGRRYLDAVNNVAHVGHSHPRVVRAAAEQLAVLNTNTRYLHELVVRYAERLAALMPEPLRVCFIVCSGSEANELALRLARAHTGQTDVIVVDGAYHGNTTTLVDISPYKCEGPGGRGLPAWVHKVSMPDVYRGRYRADDPEAAAKYAREVEQAAAPIRAAGRGVSAFFCESLLSCGGQIVLPEGYLAEAYRAVRAAGGVSVADEVQVGFGRVGTHVWGFETQGVVPDIVTLGKPIGNGFPLGAVVTRPEIAASFDNGMEYFNTFGGNPVACAAGLAVLDVIRDEGLQQNALRVGEYLKRRLEPLKAAFPIVGDVRGLGLFVGVELVRDRETLEPAGEQAGYVANRMRERGVLVSTDGPDHNVIKIKPPLCFSEGDADALVETLATVLDEDFARLGQIRTQD